MISSGPVAPLNRDPPNTEEAALRRMFTLIDVDKSGKVSKNELSTAVHNEETLQKFLDRVPVLHVLVKENNFEMHFMREFEDVDQISWQQFLQFFREEKVKRTQFARKKQKRRANVIDRILLNMDFYGDTIRGGPTWFERTSAGGVTTIFIYTVVLALIVSQFNTLLKATTISTTAERVVFNLKAPDLSLQMDFPSLYINVETILSFHEDKSSNLQRIDVKDVHGLNPSFMSKTTPVPVVKAAYQKYRIGLDTFDPMTSPIKPHGSAGTTDITGMIDNQKAIKVGAETMKAFYDLANVFQDFEGFFPHKAVAYFRFLPEELKKLKKCQLQITLMNQAEREVLQVYNALADRDHQTRMYLPAYATTNTTWAPSSFPSDGANGAGAYDFIPNAANGRNAYHAHRTAKANIFILKSHVTKEEIQDFIINSQNESKIPRKANMATYVPSVNDFLNWEFQINYVNNMLLAFSKDTCSDSGDLLKMAKPTIYANPVDSTATILTFNNSVAAFRYFEEKRKHRIDFPMQVMVFGAAGKERLTLKRELFSGSAKSESTFIGVEIERDVNGGGAVDFILTGSSSSYPSSPPTSWTCPLHFYYDGKECHCECGAYDPDCESTSARVRGCPSEKKYCSTKGKCTRYNFVSSSSSSKLVMSEACNEIFRAGETNLAGFTGDFEAFNTPQEELTDASLLCSACPGDLLYEGIPQKGADNVFYCNFKADGILDSRVLSTYISSKQAVFTPKLWRLPVVLNSKTAFPTKEVQPQREMMRGGQPVPPPSHDINAKPTSKGRPSDNGGKGHLGVKQETLWKAKGKDDYYVTLSVGSGNEETAEVFGAEAKDEATGIQILYLKFSSESTTRTHFGEGQMVGAVAKGLSHIFVIPRTEIFPPNSQPGPNDITFQGARPEHTFLFPESGPYNAAITNIPITIASASTMEAVNHKGMDLTLQALKIASLPDTSIGTVGDIAVAVSAGDMTVTLSLGSSKQASMGPQRGPGGGKPGAGASSSSLKLFSDIGQVFPLVLEGSFGVEGSEIVYVTSVATHSDFNAWTCPKGKYNAGDKSCDCNCGMYDPDCAAPTPMRFHLNSLADTRFKLNGCSAGQMCSLSGTCVSTFNGAAVPQAGANAVSQATAFVNTAGNSAFDIPPAPKPWKEILTLTAPPTSDHRIGAKAHTSFQQGHAESSVFYQSKIELARDEYSSLYLPEHRYRSNPEERFESPRELQVEAALYVIPDRPLLTKNDLCPRFVMENNASTIGSEYSSWKLNGEVGMRISKCLSPKPLASESCVYVNDLKTVSREFRSNCIREMPETFVFDFVTELPINNKWDQGSLVEGLSAAAAGTVKSQIQTPEHNVEFEHIYHFSYDKDVAQVDKSFAQHVQVGGDIDQYGKAHTFFGSLEYRGLGRAHELVTKCSGTCSDPPSECISICNEHKDTIQMHDSIPASTPYAEIQVRLMANESHTRKVLADLKKKGKWPDNWPTEAAAIDQLLSEFNRRALNITFDLSSVGGYNEEGKGVIPLEPGYVKIRILNSMLPYYLNYRYTLAAKLAVQPIYTESLNFLNAFTGDSGIKITSWKVTEKGRSVRKAEAKFFARHKTTLRFVIELDSAALQIHLRLFYSVGSFLLSLGAALGYLKFGESLLGLWQRFYPTAEEKAEDYLRNERDPNEKLKHLRSSE